MSVHAFIVLERRGSKWVLPQHIAREQRGRDMEHVPFVYVTDPKDSTPQLPADQMQEHRMREAIRYASNGLVAEGRRYLVFDLNGAMQFTTRRDPQPPVEITVEPWDLEDVVDGGAPS